MSRLHQMLCAAALVALLPLTACSSDGRFAYNSGVGGGGASGGGGGGSGGGAPTAPPSSNSATVADDAADGANVTLASAGNLAADLEDGELNDANALGRVTIGDESILGESGGAGLVGVSVNSQTQETGQLATIGLLANGQLVSTNEASANGNGDLIGAVAGENRVIGQGDQQQVSVDLLSDANAEGDLIEVDALTQGQTAGAQVDGQTLLEGVANGSILDGVTDSAAALAPRD